jgi:hypothetical protein
MPSGWRWNGGSFSSGEKISANVFHRTGFRQAMLHVVRGSASPGLISFGSRKQALSSRSNQLLLTAMGQMEVKFRSCPAQHVRDMLRQGEGRPGQPFRIDGLETHHPAGGHP